jgi:hypothetical protein
MPFVLRNEAGAIVSLHREPLAGGEALPGDHPEVQAFMQGSHSAVAAFDNLDAGLVRVLEDLIEVLVSRNVIRITDLPAAARNKLLERKDYRTRFRENALQLLPPDLH